MAIALIGIGIATTVGALTKFNQFASTSRNSTGAYTMATKKIDAILSEGPFNPQKKNEDGTAQIPPDLVPTPAGQPRSESVPIYNDPVITGGILQLLLPTDPPTFSGTMETAVTDVSPTPGTAPYIYRATVTVKYTYRGRNYSLSMSTLRTSDI